MVTTLFFGERQILAQDTPFTFIQLPLLILNDFLRSPFIVLDREKDSLRKRRLLEDTRLK